MAPSMRYICHKHTIDVLKKQNIVADLVDVKSQQHAETKYNLEWILNVHSLFHCRNLHVENVMFANKSHVLVQAKYYCFCRLGFKMS